MDRLCIRHHIRRWAIIRQYDQLYSPEGRKTEEKNTHINLTN